MDNLNFLQTGYTPELLTKMLWERGKRREDVADQLGVSMRTVHRWCVSADNPNHADMPLDTWRRFLKWISQIPAIRPEKLDNVVSDYLSGAPGHAASLQSAVDAIPLQYRSDVSEYIEQGIEQAPVIHAALWPEILQTDGIMRFKAALVALAHHAPDAASLQALFEAEPDFDLLARAIARNPACLPMLREQCITVLRETHESMFKTPKTDDELIW